MKKSHRTETRNLRISQKAYDRFRERIKYVCNLFALDSHYLLWLMEEYLNGYTHLKSGGGLVTDFAFQLLRDELDRAMTRSRRAREHPSRRWPTSRSKTAKCGSRHAYAASVRLRNVKSRNRENRNGKKRRRQMMRQYWR